MKIGCIFCAYNSESLLTKSLAPWLGARRGRIGGNDFLISAVSVPFESFNEPRTDDTLGVLERCLAAKSIDNLVLSEVPLKETEARGRALNWLVDQGVDMTIQVDADEFYTTTEIERTFSFMQSRSLIVSAKGCLKNYVFDDKTWLKDPFTPFRIHRSNYNGYSAFKFWDDNNILYADCSGREIRDIDLPWIQIPKSVQFVKHMSWISNERSKKKIEYQTLGRKWVCSFKWNYEKEKLEWNKDYFLNRSFPELESDFFVDTTSHSDIDVL